MRRRSTLATSLGTLTLLLAATLASPAASAPAEPEPGRGPTPPPGTFQGDADGDRLADDLEGLLRAASASDRLDVIVEGVRPGRARELVGSLELAVDLPIIGGFAGTMSAGQIRALAGKPGVQRISTDGTVRALDDAGNRDFGVDSARSDNVGTSGAQLDGSGIGICVVDTGVRPDHEQLSGRLAGFFDAVNGRTSAYDDHWHGTHVAGIALGDGTGSNMTTAGRAIGVAPGASLYAAKVLNAQGSGSDSQVLAGVQWCVDQGAATPPVRVISMSLGDTAVSDGTDPLSNAVNKAVSDHGMTVVVAGGNSGDVPGTVNSPGVAAAAITVAAAADWSAATTAASDTGIWLAAFSSRGPVYRTGAIKPDVTAPGVSVLSAHSGSSTGYYSASGTSMATPFVAGAAALALQADPATTPQDLKSALMTTALDRGAAGADNDWGAGLIDVRALIDSVEDEGAPVSTQVRTSFPTMQQVTGTVGPHGSTVVPVQVTSAGVGVPVALTLTVTTGSCGIYCELLGPMYGEWSPDLDMELRSSSGSRVAISECTLAGLSCATGRQETIGFRPSQADTYSLRVYEWTGGTAIGGDFRLDISRGPVTSGVAPAADDHKAADGPGSDTGDPDPPPPPSDPMPPVAMAMAEPNPCRVTGSGRKAKCTFELDGSASYDPDNGDAGGGIVGYQWKLGKKGGWTGALVTQTKGPGSYTYQLIVTDDEGATASDQVTVVVQ